MTVITMAVQPMMKDKMLNNWRAKTNYAALLVTPSGQPGATKGDSKLLSFAAARRVGGGSKLVHEESGGTDLVVGNNTVVNSFRILRSNTDFNSGIQASHDVGEEYTYGGVFRINKIEIALT